jgi:exoribonuclease R
LKAIADPDGLLTAGLAMIRTQFSVPDDFPPEVLAEAERTKDRAPTEHADWTDHQFVTLDPATSTDLDQAFALESSGSDILLHYALADIGWFVPTGGAMEAEAWKRGVTLYLPDGRARLYPAALSEGAASLLPDGPRPAIVATVRCSPAGAVALEGMTRALVHSRAKLAYETTAPGDIPLLADFSARIERASETRGAATASPPDQELERGEDGTYSLHVRAWLPSETANSALSLAANIAIAEALLAAKTGMFREMPPPDDRAIARLRLTARALGLEWPDNATFAQFNRTVDTATRAGAAFALAVRRATGHASYTPFTPGHVPWHAALGATYTHATAPMRRLADRYVLEAALALAQGKPSPSDADQLARLCKAMDTADAREGAIERAVLDLAETVMLKGREGEIFAATVTERDDRGARIQLNDLPILARVDAHRVATGEEIRVRLIEADTKRRTLRFERVN